MELTESIESLNKQLRELFGVDTITGLPMWRIAWSEDQFEKRYGTYDDFTPAGIFLRTVTEVRLVPKYRQWIKEKYALEQLTIVQAVNESDLPDQHLSYEPIFVFETLQGHYLPPRLDVSKLVIDSLYAMQGKTGLKKYKDPESTKSESMEAHKKRVDEIHEYLYGDETNIGDHLRYGTGVTVPANFNRGEIMATKTSPFVPHNLRTDRAPTNPVDRCTIVSIFPKNIIERKWTIQPGYFEIKAGTYETPSILEIGPSSWWKYMDENQPLLEVVQNSFQVAESVVRDYCNGLPACNMHDAVPGLFFIPGSHNRSAVQKDYRKLLDNARERQTNWYKALVRLGDALWARTNGSPNAIADDMRVAAKELNLNDKPWLQDFKVYELVACVACGTMRNPNFPVCANCKYLDLSHPEAKNIKFAQ